MNPDVWACVHNFLLPHEQGTLRRVATASYEGFAVCVALGNVAVYGDYYDAQLGQVESAPFPVDARALITEQRTYKVDCTLALVVHCPLHFKRSFASGQLGPFTVIDMRRCIDLSEISGDFLPSAPVLKYLHLPASLTHIGNSFLHNSAVENVDMSACTNLTRIGKSFLSMTKSLKSISLPRSITELGEHFLFMSAVENVDMSACANLTHLSDDFLRQSAIETLDMSACTKLICVRARCLSLTKRLKSVSMPSSVREIGEHFLFMSGVETLDMQACTQLEIVGQEFVREPSQLTTAKFASTVREILLRAQPRLDRFTFV
jgi:hypothetical protein